MEGAVRSLRQEMEAALLKFEQRVGEGEEREEEKGEKTRYSEKDIVERQALLSTMFEIKDYKSLYNMVIASMLLLLVTLLVECDFEDLRPFLLIFAEGETVAACWLCMAVVVFLPVGLVHCVCQLPRSGLVYLPALALLLYAVFAVPVAVLRATPQMGFGCRMILMCEAVRMSMKAHAYLRTKLLYCTPNAYRGVEVDGRRLPPGLAVTLGSVREELARFAYFFFAPTMVYRDEYRLRRERDVLAIIVHFFNFLASVFFCYMIYVLLCVETIDGLARERLTLRSYTMGVLKMVLPSVIFLLMGFFGFLHSWQSAWAELLCFPDREFYLDWWSSKDYGSYYRKWNNVIHDFLFYYVYSDLRRFFNLRKSSAQLVTFVLSAVCHELIINLAIGIFFPMLFFMFAGPGIIFYFYQKNNLLAKNIVFWLEMYIGISWVITSYLAEICSRSQIDDALVAEKYGVFAPFVPRLFFF